MRTAILTLLMCLTALTAAPSAFAEDSLDTAPEALQGSYFTQDGKHHVEVSLPQADQPQGQWIVTLNGSDEQMSPEASQSAQFTSNYDELVEGRNYQVIAVWYGENGGKTADLNTCFQFEAQDPATGQAVKTELRDCGFKAAPAPATPDVDNPLGDEPASEDGQPGPDEASGEPAAGKTPDPSEEQKADSAEEETGELHHMDSASKEGGKLPDTSVPAPWGSAGMQLILVGCALMGFRRPVSEDRQV